MVKKIIIRLSEDCHNIAGTDMFRLFGYVSISVEKLFCARTLTRSHRLQRAAASESKCLVETT